MLFSPVTHVWLFGHSSSSAKGRWGRVTHIHNWQSDIYTQTLYFSLSIFHTHTFSLFSQIPRSIWSSALEFCDHHSIEYTKNACLLFINSFPFRAWLEPASHGTLESSVVLWIFLLSQSMKLTYFCKNLIFIYRFG